MRKQRTRKCPLVGGDRRTWPNRGHLKIEDSPKLGKPTKPTFGLSGKLRPVVNAPKVGGIAIESNYAFNEYRVVPVGGVLKVEGS